MSKPYKPGPVPEQDWAGLLTDDELAKLARQPLPSFPSLADIAHDALDSLITDFRQPRFRVQFAASVLATVPCARARLPFLPSFLIAMAAGSAAAWAYTAVEDIRAKLDGPELVFHGAGCPGHTTGLPVEACLRGDGDATGDV